VKDRYDVLFLCAGNSARSIMAEAIMNKKGFPNFRAYSAGSHPKGAVHAAALRELTLAKLATTGLRSKDWGEFATPGAPVMDFVFTVCDNAAREVCPVWPGQPMTAHWGVPDPAAARGTQEQIEKAFHEAYLTLERRISLLLCLPISKLDKLAIKKEIDRIGRQCARQSRAGWLQSSSGRAFWLRQWWARGSWESAWPGEMRAWLSWRTQSPPAPRLSH